MKKNMGGNLEKKVKKGKEEANIRKKPVKLRVRVSAGSSGAPEAVLAEKKVEDREKETDRNVFMKLEKPGEKKAKKAFLKKEEKVELLKKPAKSRKKPRKEWLTEPEEIARVEKDKRMLMWTGIVFFMILIAFFWLVNLAGFFQKNTVEEEGGLPWEEWKDMSAELGDRMGDIKESLLEIKKWQEEMGEASGTPAVVATTSVAEIISDESAAGTEAKINELKNKLENK